MEGLLRNRREAESPDAPKAATDASVDGGSSSGSTVTDITGSTTTAVKTGFAKVEDMMMEQIHKCK